MNLDTDVRDNAVGFLGAYYLEDFLDHAIVIHEKEAFTQVALRVSGVQEEHIRELLGLAEHIVLSIFTSQNPVLAQTIDGLRHATSVGEVEYCVNGLLDFYPMNPEKEIISEYVLLLHDGLRKVVGGGRVDRDRSFHM